MDEGCSSLLDVTAVLYCHTAGKDLAIYQSFVLGSLNWISTWDVQRG